MHLTGSNHTDQKKSAPTCACTKATYRLSLGPAFLPHLDNCLANDKASLDDVADSTTSDGPVATREASQDLALRAHPPFLSQEVGPPDVVDAPP